MNKSLLFFEKIARRASGLSQTRPEPSEISHPFDEQNIHAEIQRVSKILFDDGHYSQATFEAYKLIDQKVKSMAGIDESGYKLMAKVFSDTKPIIKLTNLSNASEIDEQKGFQFLFSGAILAIRNPRGHECGLTESLTQCLDNLSFASMLLRRLEDVKIS